MSKTTKRQYVMTREQVIDAVAKGECDGEQ